MRPSAVASWPAWEQRGLFAARLKPFSGSFSDEQVHNLASAQSDRPTQAIERLAGLPCLGRGPNVRRVAPTTPARSGLLATRRSCAATGRPVASPMSTAPRADAVTLRPAPIAKSWVRTTEAAYWVRERNSAEP